MPFAGCIFILQITRCQLADIVARQNDGMSILLIMAKLIWVWKEMSKLNRLIGELISWKCFFDIFHFKGSVLPFFLSFSGFCCCCRYINWNWLRDSAFKCSQLQTFRQKWKGQSLLYKVACKPTIFFPVIRISCYVTVHRNSNERQKYRADEQKKWASGARRTS